MALCRRGGAFKGSTLSFPADQGISETETRSLRPPSTATSTLESASSTTSSATISERTVATRDGASSAKAAMRTVIKGILVARVFRSE